MNAAAAKYRLLVIFILMTVSPPSYSLSCTGLKNHFFVQCVHGVCVKAFLAREVHAKGSCGRRVTVEDVPDSMVQYIGQEIIKANEKTAGNETSIYDVYFVNRFYHNAPETVEELAKNFHNKNSSYAKLNNIEVLVQGTDFDLLKKKWLEQSDRELLQTRVFFLIDVGMLTFFFILLLYTLVKYSNLTKGLFRKEPNQRKILKLLLIQAGLLGLGLIPLFVYMEGAVYILLLIPIIIMAWVYEVIFYVSMLLKEPDLERR